MTPRILDRNNRKLTHERQYELQITHSGIEFISVPAPPVPLTDVALSQHDESRSQTPQYRSWEEEVREMPPPSRSARLEQRRVSFQEPLEEKYSSDDKWLLSLQTSSSTAATVDYPTHKPSDDDRTPPVPDGDQVVEHPPLGFRRKWLPVENFYPYE